MRAPNRFWGYGLEDGLLDGEGDRLGVLLARAGRAFRTTADYALVELGITIAQYRVLLELAETPGVTAAYLSRLHRVTPQTMHGIVTRLERGDLIERRANPMAPKARPIRLSPRGHRLLRWFDGAANVVERQLQAAFTDEERLVLERMLRECIQALETIEFHG